MSALLLAVLLGAAPARGAGRTQAPVEPTALVGGIEVPLHPLMVPSLSEPDSPLLGSLARRAERAAALAAGGASTAVIRDDLAAAARYPAARALEPVAARVLARVLGEPGAADALIGAHPVLRGSAIEAVFPRRPALAFADLAAAARADALVARVFEGAPAPEPELDGLTFRPGLGGMLRSGFKPGARLGRGHFGVVFDHPVVPGAVVKIGDILPDEDEVAWQLYHASVGPRPLGAGTVGLDRARVSERVYGETLERLVRRRAFGLEEYELVKSMLRRAADAGLRIKDMRLANMMVGRTLLDPTRRAFHVDGWHLYPEGHLPLEARLARQTETLVRIGYTDRAVGEAPTKTLEELLEEGVARKPGPLRRAWRAFFGE